MTRLGIVTGLSSEAACLRVSDAGGDILVICAGADAVRAAQAGRRLIEHGCQGLLSFGIAGGLDPVLAAGALVIPRRVRDGDGDIVVVDETWHRRLIALLDKMAVNEGDIVGSSDLLASTQAKRLLRQRTMAAAVDMESLALGRVARQAALPFLAIRAVADPADRAPPAWAMESVDAAGHVRPFVALGALLRRPAEIPTASRLARDSRAALATLRRVAARAGPLFGF